MYKNISQITHTHLNYQERRIIYERLRYTDTSISNIAQELGRSPRTIYRELERQEVSPPKIKNKTRKKKYDDERAQKEYEQRWKRAHLRACIKDTRIQKIIIIGLIQHHTPKQIAGRMKRIYKDISISHETIYQWIYHDRSDLGIYLPSKKKKRRSYRKKGAISSRIPQRVGIEQRKILENMDVFGHWEIDLLGAPSRETILTVIEKYSRYTFYHHIPDSTAHTIMYGILFTLRNIPKSHIVSITYDNGSENVLHQEINERLSSRSYFCNPYAAWEKGQVEYANRLIRRYFPKGTRFDTITHEDIAQVQHMINHRPRECLDFRSPAEVFSDFVHVA